MRRAFKSFKNNFKKTLENDNTLIRVMFNFLKETNCSIEILVVAHFRVKALLNYSFFTQFFSKRSFSKTMGSPAILTYILNYQNYTANGLHLKNTDLSMFLIHPQSLVILSCRTSVCRSSRNRF